MTATAKATIDWNKPVQARWSYVHEWHPVRVLCTDRPDSHSVVCLIAACDNKSILAQVRIDGTGCNYEFRNTPAPPVPFDYTKYVNVYRYSDGTEALGDMYDSLDKATASARRAVGVQVATVPVTIRGEWPGENDNG